MFCLQKRTTYAEFVKLCAACPTMRKIVRTHNGIIPLPLSSAGCTPAVELTSYKGVDNLPGFRYNLWLRSRDPDLWPSTHRTPKLTVLCLCPVDHLCQLASRSVHSFSKYHVHNFVTDRRTNGPTDWEHNASACRSGPIEAQTVTNT